MTFARALIAGWVILFIAILATGYETNHLSCERADGLRAAAHVYFIGGAVRAGERARIDDGATRRLDLQAQASARRAAALTTPIDCGTLFPGTK